MRDRFVADSSFVGAVVRRGLRVRIHSSVAAISDSASLCVKPSVMVGASSAVPDQLELFIFGAGDKK